jgi:hypothetical protein
MSSRKKWKREIEVEYMKNLRFVNMSALWGGEGGRNGRIWVLWNRLSEFHLNFTRISNATMVRIV